MNKSHRHFTRGLPMENKHRNSCPTSFATRLMKLKPWNITTYLSEQLNTTTTTKICNNKCRGSCREIRSLIRYWYLYQCKLVLSFWKIVWQFLIKLNMPLPFDPIVLLLDMYHGKMKTYVHTKTYTWMFITAFSVITKNRNKPRCPSVGEKLNRLWDPIQCLTFWTRW